MMMASSATTLSSPGLSGGSGGASQGGIVNRSVGGTRRTAPVRSRAGSVRPAARGSTTVVRAEATPGPGTAAGSVGRPSARTAVRSAVRSVAPSSSSSSPEEPAATLPSPDQGSADGGGDDTAVRLFEAIGIPRQLMDDFSREYQLLVHDAAVAEKEATNIRRIVDANFAVYKLVSSFLESIRSFARRNTSETSNRVMVAVHDLDTLESEREMRLLRSIVANNAETIGLGNTFLASIDPSNLKRSLTEALNNAAKAGSADGTTADNDDESAEERQPEKVNLDNSNGLYSIRNTADALSLNQLIGYEAEANEIISFCRRVDFVLPSQERDGGQSDSARNPVVIILYGPPGTGKTTIAQSVAKYLDFVYMYVNAENVTSQWSGVTEKNIAKLFRRARIASLRYALSPARPRQVLMLIDEIDGLIKNRATAANLSGEEYGRITTFLQMLTPPIGTNNSNIVAIFTTNRLENLDAAVVNRARGRIFMGYVTSPADRFKLYRQIYADYVQESLENAALERAAIECDDLVPRDLQNVLAQVKNRILDKFAAVSPTENLRIDLSNLSNRVTLGELLELLRGASPATPANVLFNDYSPPRSHICRWLNENAQFLEIARSAPIYGQFRSLC